MNNDQWNKKVDLVDAWVKDINEHWHRLGKLGILHTLGTDNQFWAECITNRSNDCWWAWIDVARALKIQAPELFQKYPYCDSDLDIIQRRLHTAGSEPISRNRKDLFRAVMNMKDVINAGNGTPTKQYPVKKQKKASADKPKPAQRETVFDSLFEIQR